MGSMSPTVHAFDWPDRFVVGAVGEPGQRTFFLQVKTGLDVLSVSLEKQQAAALADRIDEVPDTLMAEDGNPFSVPSGTPVELDDVDPLDEPVDDLFRAGTMSLMLAAPEAARLRHAAVLSDMAAKVFPISARAGDAARVKLLNNLLAAANLVAGASALAAGERMGLDPAVLQQVIAASSGQSWITDDRLPRALAGDYAPRAHAIGAAAPNQICRRGS